MYKERFYKMLEHCQLNKIKVTFYDGEDICYPKVSLVCINNKQPWRKRLYTLLHELGHIEIYRNKEDWSKSFSMFSIDVDDGRVRRSKKYQISLIAEEIDAWRIGRQIANDCGVFIDNDDYINLMNECVYSYVKDASIVINK